MTTEATFTIDVTGAPQVKALADLLVRYREALEKIEGGEGCYTPSYGDCCDMRCAQVAREALRAPPDKSEEK